MNKYKVVIIDDEPWTREVIKSLGEWDNKGLEIVGEASDGEYGLELIRQMSPDIILTDVRMPQLSGIELIEILRKEGNKSLVIFISGYDNYLYIRSALKLEVVDYLLKPIKQEELNNQLEQCITLLSERTEGSIGSNIEEGFLNVSWAGKFGVLRDALYDSLCSCDLQVIQQKFDAIRQFIQAENSKESLLKGNMICIYYTLMNVLQRFIISREYMPAEIFGNETTTFVFSSEGTLEEMLSFVYQLYLKAASAIQEFTRARNKLDVGKIKMYAKEHYTEGITLEQTAELFYVSKEYLSKIFKASVGKGFSEYITALRMEKAKELILDYKIPIKEVGSLVGYMDQAHFYKTFKKYYSKTPGEIREINN